MLSTTKQIVCLIFVLFCLSFSTILSAEEQPLESITVRSVRIEQAIYKIPSAVSVVENQGIQIGRQQLGLDESLTLTPVYSRKIDITLFRICVSQSADLARWQLLVYTG